MIAVIHWTDGEPHSHCKCEHRPHEGKTGTKTTPYVLEFEGRWHRIHCTSKPGNPPKYRMKLDGADYSVTLQNVPVPA